MSLVERGALVQGHSPVSTTSQVPANVAILGRVAILDRETRPPWNMRFIGQ
jgi:hypothetical protein